MKFVLFIFLVFILRERIAAFDYSSFSLTSPQPLPVDAQLIGVNRVNFSAVVVNEYLYVIGSFYHADLGGQAANTTLVLLLNGTNHKEIPMRTPRGFATSILFNETLIFLIGGSFEYDTPQGLPVVEALQLDLDNPSHGNWLTYPNMTKGRINPSSTLVGGGIVIALGGNEVVEFLNVTDPAYSYLPSLPSGVCQGVIATLDSDSVVILCSGDSNHASLLLSLSGHNQWETLSVTPLSPWTIQSIQPITADSFLFLADTKEHSSFVFFLSDGNITQYVCFTGYNCSGTTVLTPDAWLCLFEGDTEPLYPLQPPSLPIPPGSTPGWPSFRQNPSNTGQSTGYWSCYPSFGASLAQKWNYTVSGKTSNIYSTPVIGEDGTIYFGAGQMMLALFSNGTQKWNVTQPGNVDIGFLLVGDVLYVPGTPNLLSALNATTGVGIWNYTYSPSLPGLKLFGNRTPPSGLTSQGLIWMGSEAQNEVVGINYTTGARVRLEEISPIQMAPAVGEDGTAYFGCSSCMDISSSSTTRFVYNSSGPILFSSPAIGLDGSTVYFGSVDGNLRAFTNQSQGLQLKWTFPTNSMILSGITIGINNSVYFTNSQGTLFCLRDDGDIATLVWSVSLGNFSYNHFSSPVVTLDNSVFVCISGYLQAVDGYTGTVKWTVAVACDESGPVIHSDGTVYVTQGYGQIFAFDGSILNGRWLDGPFVPRHIF